MFNLHSTYKNISETTLTSVNTQTTKMGKEYKKTCENNSKKITLNNRHKNKDNHIFRIVSSKQSSDCENTSQCLVKNIKKECITGKDASKYLSNLTRPDSVK